MYIPRAASGELLRLAEGYPVVTLTGPRQSGKTTLARHLFPDRPYRSLEDPDVRRLATDDPRRFLEPLEGGAILDEIQRAPELLSYLQGMVDSSAQMGRFILTGSAQFTLLESITQTLAGRTALLTLLPLSMLELSEAGELSEETAGADALMLRGFYPAVWSRALDPTRAYRNYFQTYVERDVRMLINVKDLSAFERFMKLCAGRVGQLLNAASLASDVGVSQPTIRSWITTLQASYVVFLLQPYHANIGKRLVKTPKLYFYDVGLAAYLLGIESEQQLSRDPLRGGLFENLVIAELVKARLNQGLDPNLYFYRDRSGHEVDALFARGRELMPIEIKSSQTYHGSLLKGLRWFMGSGVDGLRDPTLIFAGAQRSQVGALQVLPFLRAGSLLGELDSGSASGA